MNKLANLYAMVDLHAIRPEGGGVNFKELKKKFSQLAIGYTFLTHGVNKRKQEKLK